MVKRKAKIKWWHWILGIDLFLVAITSLHKYPIQFPGKWTLSYPFNLANEMNVAAWWSGMNLLVVSAFCYVLFRLKEEPVWKAWLVLAVVFAGLSLDEIGAIHERVGNQWGFTGYLPFILILLLLVGYALSQLYRFHETRKSALYITLCFVLFGLVAGFESLEKTVAWPSWFLGLRDGLEEGTELAGSLLALNGLVIQTKGRGDGFRGVIPDLQPRKTILTVIVCSFLVHVLAILLTINIIDAGSGGNPFSWYPTSVFFLLFIIYYRFYSNIESKKARSFNVYAWIYLVFSTFTVFKPYEFFENAGISYSRINLDKTFIILSLALLIFKCFIYSKSINKTIYFVIVLNVIMSFLYIFEPTIFLKYTYLGLCVCSLFYVTHVNFEFIERDISS